MAHQMEPKIQEEIRAIPGNDMCVDCGSKNPQWASVSYGTLFCLECSGQHRHLGVHISFVRSVTMDSWSEKQIQSMRLGGNAKLIDWFKKNGVDPRASIQEKYHTDAAELYRLRLAAVRDGKPVPDELPPKAPPAPVQAQATTSDRPLTGFGSQPMPQSRSGNDPLDEITKTASELGKTASQTFSMLAGTFTSLGKEAADKLKEVKISEKLAQTGDSLAKTGEKFTETLKDPDLAQKAQVAATQSWQKVSSSALNFWKTVVDPNAATSASSSNAGGSSSGKGSSSNYVSMNQDDDEDERLMRGDDDDGEFHDDDDDMPPSLGKETPQTIRSAPKLTSAPSSSPSGSAPASQNKQKDENDEAWIQQQLEQMGKTPASSSTGASTAPSSGGASQAGGKKNEDFFSQFGV